MKVGWHHHASAQPVDLGEDPPLVVGPSGPEAFGRRAVSVRWLAGTVLTGITSTVLMGGALIGALDGRYSITLPASAHVATLGDATGVGPAAKGDRMRPTAEEISNKQIIEVSTVTHLGNRNLIKKQPYALVTASLVTRTSDIVDDIPPFNPLSIFADTTVFPSKAATDAIYDAQVDGEITITEHDFPIGTEVALAEGAQLSTEEAEAQLREQQWFDGTASIEFAARSLASDHRFDFGFADPRTGDAAISITPENVSEVVKRAEDGGDGIASDEVVALVASGDTLADILKEYGATEDSIEAIESVLQDDWNVAEVSAGQTVRMEIERFGFDDNAGSRPVRVSIYNDAEHLATVAMTDDEEFVAAQPPADVIPMVATAADAINPQPRQGRAPTVYDSLYQTALEHDVPEKLIDNLVRTYSFDVDLNGHVRPGDQFTVLYAAHKEAEDADSPPEILYTSLTAGGVERRFYRFRTPDDSSVDFYDENGKSAQKFLMRKPMARGVFRSGFGYRRHPILGYSKLHSGVDWAAPRGTPIYASGNGTVEEAGWKAGYGRWTLIKHANGYETGYAHQSGWADGLKKGVRVTQGQLIGYVGSTGLSTGPHLHYEVHVNGRPVDPLRIRLPRGRELTGEMLTAFEHERERIDALIERELPSETRVARN
ncbi:M23 family metallopeptidase [Amorphus sp. 3PC139-8]|uniref:M23 family metallopeptidase n=1 Tax=Amorphus sp. 3PC139-8 TaxID=2735676 RepID=UPI00345CDF48